MIPTPNFFFFFRIDVQAYLASCWSLFLSVQGQFMGLSRYDSNSMQEAAVCWTREGGKQVI